MDHVLIRESTLGAHAPDLEVRIHAARRFGRPHLRQDLFKTTPKLAVHPPRRIRLEALDAGLEIAILERAHQASSEDAHLAGRHTV
jgi:hypothetical protein